MSMREQFINKMADDRSYCLIPPETDAQEIVNLLCEVLLNNETPPMPMNMKQKNTWIADQILTKYSIKYDKDVSKARKQRINLNEGYDMI